MIEGSLLKYRKSKKIARGEGASRSCNSQAHRAPRQLGARMGDSPLDAAPPAVRSLQRTTGLHFLPRNQLLPGVLSPMLRFLSLHRISEANSQLSPTSPCPSRSGIATASPRATSSAQDPTVFPNDHLPWTSLLPAYPALHLQKVEIARGHLTKKKVPWVEAVAEMEVSLGSSIPTPAPPLGGR